MNFEKLYTCAFEYKKTKLWKSIYDTNLFAVKLNDGRIGYVSVMGLCGEHCALALYIGDDGYDSLRSIFEINEFELSYLEYKEYILQQDCMQCVFACKDELSKDEIEQARKYAREHGLRISGKNAYPQFLKYQPNCFPWALQTEEEIDVLCEALSAAIELAKLLKGKTLVELGFVEVNEKTKEIPLLEQCNGVYTVKSTVLPKRKPKKWPAPKAENDIAVARLKKIKKRGVWECGIVRCPEPTQKEPDEVPFFPVALLAADTLSDYVLPIPIAGYYEKNPEILLDLFIDKLLSENICPAKIKVRDERTYSFAKSLCDKLGISLCLEDNLFALKDAENLLLDHFNLNSNTESEFSLDQAEAMLQILLSLDDEALRNLPIGLRADLEFLLDQKLLSNDLEKELRSVLSLGGSAKSNPKKPKSKSKNKSTEESYVISVSLRAGCYRHIKISDNSTLYKLHTAILDAFGFVDDHAHAFFMDNIVWSEDDCYYADFIETLSKKTKRFKLNQVGLYKGKQFKYVFDFGDEWIFQCKVLRVENEKTDKPTVIKSVGEAPEQYGYCDDLFEDDDILYIVPDENVTS